ncbi:MAG: biotin/lipoyl-containing protein, partial [Betaproteobacteria bacterium]
MTTEINVPALGESVTEATVARWFKAEGDPVARDEALVELETDKVTLEVNAPAAGILEQISAPEGSEVEVGGVLGLIAEGEVASATTARPQAAAPREEAKEEPEKEKELELERESREEPRPRQRPAAEKAPGTASGPAEALSPAVRKLIEEHDLDPSEIAASGKDGRLTKGDVLAFVEGGGRRKGEQREGQAKPQPEPATAVQPQQREPAPVVPFPTRPAGPREERVRMTRLRKMVAARLKSAQNTPAMLTTFNEVDMTQATEIRNRYRDAFEKKHGVRLGFMSMFVKAAVVALQEFPAVNADIDNDDIVY